MYERFLRAGIFGANGITKAEGFTTPDANEALVKQTAIERCKNRFVLADYSKFGCISSVTFSAFVNAKILTDNCPAEFLYSIVDIFIFYTISQIFEVWL